METEFIRRYALEIARELDRRGLIVGARGDRAMTDTELLPVIETLLEYLPANLFVIYWTKDKHLNADYHSRGGINQTTDISLGRSKRDAMDLFMKYEPDAVVLTVENITSTDL